MRASGRRRPEVGLAGRRWGWWVRRIAKAGESTEGGFPALSTVFGDANKPVQLFGKSRDADDNGDEGGTTTPP